MLRPGEGNGDRTGRNWREAACGTLSYYDAQGKRLQTISHDQMPQSSKTDLKRWLTQESSHALKMRPDLTMVAVADGAPDNWTFLSGLLPNEESLDFFHAATHLSTASEHAAKPENWFRRWRAALRDKPDGVERVIRAIRHLKDRARTDADRQEVATVLAYFCTHRHRMRYHELRRRRLAIASGIVEVANKTHIGERLKRSGMRWGLEGGQAILTFRSLVKSNRFDAAWDRLMETLGPAGSANDNRKCSNHALAA